MFIGRKSELAGLEQQYAMNSDSVVILYGREGIGKTRLIKEFAKDKRHSYYLGRELSKAEQDLYLVSAMEEVRRTVGEEEPEGFLFVVDEFDRISKGNKEFAEQIASFIEEMGSKVMFVLMSSSIQWIENEMVKSMPKLASKITSFIKLKEFSFLEVLGYFPDMPTETCIAITGILGGVPKYLEYWNPRQSVKENIKRLFLQKNAIMNTEATRFLKLDLRELSVYNTVLSILAEDEYKLNYLYKRSGFSRAKISVYIKNLIQLDVAHKIFSFEPERRENIQKGLYGITDSFLHFWYRFIYPRISEAEWETPEDFYQKYIEPELDDYMELAFIRVCQEYLELMNEYKRLPMQYDTLGSLYGKEGFIPIITQNKEGKMLVGSCKWSEEPMNREEFQKLLAGMEQTGREADYYYLFSKTGFEEKLGVIAKGLENVILVDLEHL